MQCRLKIWPFGMLMNSPLIQSEPASKKQVTYSGSTIGNNKDRFRSVGNAVTRNRPILLQLMIENADFIFALRPIDPAQAEELLSKLSQVYKCIYWRARGVEMHSN